MQNTLPVRKRFSATQRSDLLTAYQRSGLTQRAFAAQAGISLGSLAVWLRRSKAALSGPPPGFQELPRQGLSTPQAVAAYKLHFSNGVSLEVARGFGAEELTRLCGLVRNL